MSANVGDEFKPGEKVPQSGIYDVLHDRNHYQRHQVTCVHGEPFPPCNHCGNGVRFRLAVKAMHISNHEHFK
jgi:hypothetical protein